MSEAGEERETTRSAAELSNEPLRYPADHVLGVIDTTEQVERAVDALTSGGFLESEIQATSGREAAERLRSTTGRTGLSSLVIRIAERLGIQDDEMHLKSLYEDALHDGRYVVAISAPTDERRDIAVRILRDHHAHTVAFLGRYSITPFVPPKER